MEGLSLGSTQPSEKAGACTESLEEAQDRSSSPVGLFTDCGLEEVMLRLNVTFLNMETSQWNITHQRVSQSV